MGGPFSFDLDIAGGPSDEECDPPNVYICDSDGCQIIEVLEDPISKSGQNKWDIDDWEPGPFARKLLELMNANMGESDDKSTDKSIHEGPVKKGGLNPPPSRPRPAPPPPQRPPNSGNRGK